MKAGTPERSRLRQRLVPAKGVCAIASHVPKEEIRGMGEIGIGTHFHNQTNTRSPPAAKHYPKSRSKTTSHREKTREPQQITERELQQDLLDLVARAEQAKTLTTMVTLVMVGLRMLGLKLIRLTLERRVVEWKGSGAGYLKAPYR